MRGMDHRIAAYVAGLVAAERPSPAAALGAAARIRREPPMQPEHLEAPLRAGQLMNRQGPRSDRTGPRPWLLEKLARGNLAVFHAQQRQNG
jgi:hypothetical protein